MLQNRPLRYEQVASLDYWLDQEVVELIPYTKNFEEMQKKAMFILHSSGTTGMPKPRGITHGLLGVTDNYHDLPMPEDRDSLPKLWAQEKRMFNLLPPFHVSASLSDSQCKS